MKRTCSQTEKAIQILQTVFYTFVTFTSQEDGKHFPNVNVKELLIQIKRDE
jgi:hypothetical protein